MPRILGHHGAVASLPPVTPGLYIMFDLALLGLVVAALVVVGQGLPWITGFAAIWLALSAPWLLLEAWWRRSA